ncbi:hypothetical protein [Vacuolonema iberomarrocanum]|uniref:hypothetical protein n=1 Tax=Vacuolonema iberomarrocanum TaxID=3454632 RepID=UPI001A0A2D61|nr:hypothetical protein [filamentous cyanobacterium LEGE 07170]
MFRVLTRGYSEDFERWTDALETANSLKPKCRSWLQDIRIFDGEDLVWVYSRSHAYPQYIGAGTYNRLARLFIQEAIAEETISQESEATNTSQQDTDGKIDPAGE